MRAWTRLLRWASRGGRGSIHKQVGHKTIQIKAEVCEDCRVLTLWMGAVETPLPSSAPPSTPIGALSSRDTETEEAPHGS